MLISITDLKNRVIQHELKTIEADIKAIQKKKWKVSDDTETERKNNKITKDDTKYCNYTEVQ